MRSSNSRLKKVDLLRGYHTFSRVIAEGKSLQHASLRCFYLADHTMKNVVRAGFAVNRGVRTAVERNRARRWMREAYRRNKAMLSSPAAPIASGANVVFLLRTRSGVVRRKDFRKGVDQAMIVLLKELRQRLGGER